MSLDSSTYIGRAFLNSRRKVSCWADTIYVHVPTYICTYKIHICLLKFLFGCIFEGLGMENIGILYDHLVCTYTYFTAVCTLFITIWYSLWSFGMYFPIWWTFLPIWCIYQFGIFCGHFISILSQFVLIWYVFFHFDVLYREKFETLITAGESFFNPCNFISSGGRSAYRVIDFYGNTA
jgi:hypothetical protein